MPSMTSSGSRRTEPRADDDLGHEDERHGQEKAGVSGKIQQQGFPGRRPERPALDQGEEEERNPGDQQESDHAPPEGRPPVLDQTDPLSRYAAGPPSSNSSTDSCSRTVVMLAPIS